MQGSAGQRRVPTDFIRLFESSIPQSPGKYAKFADVLDESAQQIVALETQIQELSKEKKALMQLLLTGKQRVLVNA